MRRIVTALALIAPFVVVSDAGAATVDCKAGLAVSFPGS